MYNNCNFGEILHLTIYECCDKIWLSHEIINLETETTFRNIIDSSSYDLSNNNIKVTSYNLTTL